MNELYQQEFVNQALQSGVPRQKIAALLERAEQISRRGIKTASPKLDLVDSLIKGAGLEKSASSISYVQGVLGEAFANGANVPQAYEFAKQALDATAKRVSFMEKVSEIANHPQLNQYAEGFLMAAKQAGLTHDESVSLLVDLVDREKRAAGDDQMFKQSPGAGGPPPSAPDGDPSAGMPPGGGAMGPGGDPSSQGGAGGSDPQEAQILQMLASLPPQEQQQIIQQLLAAISGGGQGGPGGPPPGAGGPPPSAGGPPPGAGGPPPGGPQGPA